LLKYILSDEDLFIRKHILNVPVWNIWDDVSLILRNSRHFKPIKRNETDGLLT
jgi:hypothetical protein